MTYVFDIDGTICEPLSDSKFNDYHDVKPYTNRIKHINRLYDEGHTIIMQTARGMGRSKNNQLSAYVMFYEMTLSQLKNWGVKHHGLYLGKPAGDIYVDDKGQSDADFFAN